MKIFGDLLYLLWMGRLEGLYRESGNEGIGRFFRDLV
jgi:hypothetical protein